MKKALHKMFTWDKWGALARLQMQCIKTSWALGERHYSGCEKQNPDILLFKEEMYWCYMADNARRTHFALWLFFLGFRSALEITVFSQQSICHWSVWFISLCWWFLSWIIAVLSCFCCGFKNSFKGTYEKKFLNGLLSAWKASWDIKLLTFLKHTLGSSIVMINITLTCSLYIGTGPVQV